jgi:3-hydroxyisobutyrate dehydrogenase-like beta-hydroxyacid dehydrogenase
MDEVRPQGLALRVGFYGMGRMGVPMATNLVQAGHAVAVGNRTLTRCEPLERLGCAVAATPAELAREADVVITMVSDAAAAREVYFADDGILAGARPGTIVIDMSTVGPPASRELAEACEQTGLRALDAPVSGSIPAAQAATLIAMVGGEREVFETARPVLAAMTREQFHLGGTGAGQAMKLGINSMIATTNLALSEALVLAERSGIDRAVAYAVLKESAIASPFVHYKEAAFLDPDGADRYFSVSLLQKDVDLALALGRELQVPMLSAAVTSEALTLTSAFGWAHEDVNRVADALRRLTAQHEDPGDPQA